MADSLSILNTFIPPAKQAALLDALNKCVSDAVERAIAERIASGELIVRGVRCAAILEDENEKTHHCELPAKHHGQHKANVFTFWEDKRV